MPRFVNALTGVAVNVDDSSAAQLGSDWGQAGGGASRVAEPDTEEQRAAVDAVGDASEAEAVGTIDFVKPEPRKAGRSRSAKATEAK